MTSRHASQRRDGQRSRKHILTVEQEPDDDPVDASYLRDPITLRLSCVHCLYTRLHQCQAVDVKSGIYQKVETCCLGCGNKVTR